MKRSVKVSMFAIAMGAALSATSAANAQPYCGALLDEAKLEKKYKRLAPIHSSQDTGWMFTTDMMDETYAMKPEALSLFQQIVAEFDQAGVPLAVMVAPPRPVIAGQDVVDATLGGMDEFDVAKTQASFQELIAQMRASGAVVPDLLETALNTPDYFFKRDTHWTNTGAAQSANALASVMSTKGFDTAALPVIEMADERGSLSDIVDATCNLRDAAETTPVYDFASLGGGDLLGDAPVRDVRVALLGTSFSDRYKRDAYQVADAVATALNADVENFSVSGGGMIGPIEAFVLSGQLAEKSHDLVIWEFPYTESLNSTSALRQLLGALRAVNTTGTGAQTITLDKKGRAEIKVDNAAEAFDLVLIDAETADLDKLFVDVMFADKSKKTIQLRRRSRVRLPDDAVWSADLSGLDTATISKIKLRSNSKKAGSVMTLSLGS